MSSISDRLPATKKDLREMESRLKSFIQQQLAGEPALIALREKLEKSSSALAVALEQNKQTKG